MVLAVMNIMLVKQTVDCGQVTIPIDPKTKDPAQCHDHQCILR